MADIFKVLAQDLKLGYLRESPKQLSGGALHKMWHLVTDQGEYAAKEINQHITTKSSFPQSYESAEEIAGAFAQHGFPAVSAIKMHDHFVHRVQEKWFIVYPKVEGKIIPLNELGTVHAAQIGKIFYKMHNLNLSINGVDKSHYDEFSDEYWENLIKRAEFDVLIQLIPSIKKWNNLYKQAIPVLNDNLRVTHRDLHHTNVLWDKDVPWIIDWESAGLMNPMMEIVGYSLEWAGIIVNHTINKPILESLLHAYCDSIDIQSSQTPIDCAFYGWLGHCVLGWTEFNLRRLCGLVSNDKVEIQLGKEILETKMIPCLNYISEYDESLISLLKDTLNRH